MPKITFLKDYTVQAVDGETYKKDETYELNEASAARFVRKGVALYAEQLKSARRRIGAKRKAVDTTKTSGDTAVDVQQVVTPQNETD